MKYSYQFDKVLQINHEAEVRGGLVGTEAPWQIAQVDISVTLYEMRPVKQSPAHHSPELA